MALASLDVQCRLRHAILVSVWPTAGLPPAAARHGRHDVERLHACGFRAGTQRAVFAEGAQPAVIAARGLVVVEYPHRSHAAKPQHLAWHHACAYHFARHEPYRTAIAQRTEGRHVARRPAGRQVDDATQSVDASRLGHEVVVLTKRCVEAVVVFETPGSYVAVARQCQLETVRVAAQIDRAQPEHPR